MKGQTTRRSLRSAIYTRVSTEQGLEQDFIPSTPSGKRARPTSRAKRTRVGDWFGIVTTTAASPAGRWIGQRCRSCSSTCRRDGST